MSGIDDADAKRRDHRQPYSPRNPIPTITKYHAEKKKRQENAVGDVAGRYDDSDIGADGRIQDEAGDGDDQQDGDEEEGNVDDRRQDDSVNGEDEVPKDTSEADPASLDPRHQMKMLKKRRRERAEREVTDPVTHLPVTIHDFTDDNLKELDEDEPPEEAGKRTATGLSNKSKTEEDLEKEGRDLEKSHAELVNLFPPPEFDNLRQEIASINKTGMTVGMAGMALIGCAATYVERLLSVGRLFTEDEQQTSLGWRIVIWIVIALVGVGLAWAIVAGVREWITKKVEQVFQDEVWDAHRQEIKRNSNRHETETTVWLNSLLNAVWPLINPDLFTSLADTLEDVMQASLPKLVRMVSVDDIGQGSESLRILGVRWLPTGAAARSVGRDGKLADREAEKEQNDRKVPGEGEVSQDAKEEDGKGDGDSEDKDGDDGVAEGMEAEEGDFVNLEVAFAYRSRSTSHSLKDRTKDMHLYLAFYLPGSVKLPVWVDLRGVIGTMRLRLQLTPDPPFFALCTLTFLGQPKVDLSCVPLNKHALNIMDVPLISNFVQSAVDAAMAEYVAPKSLTLDLKDMLAGDDFKKDTNARGILVVNIRRGYDFQTGDTGIPLIKDGSSDPYVSVGWAKFGKPIFSTRIMMSEMEPCWDETAYLLVTPNELNVEERLRLQLWDSDRFTADDDLGRIEVDLKSIMRDEKSNNKMHKRTDGFRALKAGENMPGKLEWSVGYFSKVPLQPCQFEAQDYDEEVRTREQLEAKVTQRCERKLRETMLKEGKNERDESEFEQQKAQDMKAEQDAMMIRAPPPDGYPSGIFSIQIHQITGLDLIKERADDKQSYDEQEEGDGLPSAYCTVIINHKNVFKTRTKPQNAKPFYNAGCERFIRDWRECEVAVSVRDARTHEDDPLLGIVLLSLEDLFKKRSQVNGFWPISGGIGYGRIRLSMVWRSVRLDAPRNQLGWDVGTLEIQPSIEASGLSDELKSAKLKFRTNISSGKMYAHRGEANWTSKRGKSLKLAVQKRYTSCLSIAFKEKAMMKEKNAAFSILWLKDIPDEHEQELELSVWKGDFARATSCCLEEPGEKVGSIRVKVNFWSGMGAAHSKWASKDQTLREVVEVLDAARDNLESDRMERAVGIVDEDGDTSSESDSDSDGPGNDGEDAEGDGAEGKTDKNLLERASDYQRNKKSTHRKHRGVMQWKIPRTAKWMKNKAGQVGDGASGVFKMHTKEAGIETEV